MRPPHPTDADDWPILLFPQRGAVARLRSSLLGGISLLVYRRALRHHPTHPLVQLAHDDDLAPLITACAASYHPAAPPIARRTVAVLLKAEIVRAWARDCSDAVLERLILTHLVVRWFVGLTLLDPVPDQRTLQRFHTWLTTHHPQILAPILARLSRRATRIELV